MIGFVILILIAGAGAAGFRMLRRSNAQSSLALAVRLDRYGAGAAVAPAAAQAQPEINPATSAVVGGVDRLLGRGKHARKVQVKLERADLKMSAAEFITINIGTGAAGIVVGYLVHGLLGLLVLGAAGVVAPNIYLGQKVKRRRKKFVEQLADMAQMMGNSMRAGFSIMQSMELVGQESEKPASVEFERVVTEVRLGLTIDAALDHMLQRMPSEDLELMVIAINVQRVVGGNLAEILIIISNTIRERVRFQRDLQALTAQARYSSYIITLLPITVAVIINFIDQPYESTLYTSTLGYVMLSVSVIMLSIGFFILRKIADIEV